MEEREQCDQRDILKKMRGGMGAHVINPGADAPQQTSNVARVTPLVPVSSPVCKVENLDSQLVQK